MKTRKPKQLSKRVRRLTELQIQEYIDRYHPAMGKVSVAISPSGNVVAVRLKSPNAKA